MSRKLWKLVQSDKEAAATLAESCEIDPFLSLLLYSRGFSDDEQIYDFLHPDATLSDPFELIDMEAAAERVEQALEGFEKIAVFGDYDADGVTAAALLYLYLRERGANVVCILPDRMRDGYGLSPEAVERLFESGVRLIVTVDNGIAALDAAARAKELGIDLVVTDHHRPGEVLPDAVAVVDPHRADCPSEFKDNAGVGVAFKLAAAIEGDPESVLERYADLIALGTLADVVPLRGENRALVCAGLGKLNRAPRIGLAALMAAAGCAGRYMHASSVVYTLAPRINAAGRMGSAEPALQLLLCDDAAEADALAQRIDACNRERQAVEAEVCAEAIEKIEADPGIQYASVLVVAGEGWHPGVVGIVAARLVTRYGKPAVVISLDGKTGKGSCRSIEGFSIYDALDSARHTLTHFGGHPGAAGIGIRTEDIPALRAALDEYAKSTHLPFPTLTLDCKLNPAYIGLPLLDALEALEPCGSGNPAPLFGLYGMTLVAAKPVGEGKHLRLTFEKGRTELQAMLFSVTLAQFPYRPGDLLDLAVQIERNTFRGETSASVRIRDLRFSHPDEENYLKSLRLYERYRFGDRLTGKERTYLLPSREFLLKVYQFVRDHSPWAFDTEVFCKRSGCPECYAARVRVAFDVLCELKLFEKQGETYTCVHAKADLAASEILKALSEEGA